MSNKTEEIKNQETEQHQEQKPEAEPKAAENQQPAEQNTEKEFKKFLFWEVRRAPKDKKSKNNDQEPKKDGKWGFGKAVAVATGFVTVTGAAVKVADMVLSRKYGDCNYQYESEVPSYQQQAVEGQYQDVPASENE